MTELLHRTVYLELVYLVTALVPSDTAGLASLPRKEPGLVQWLRLNNSREKYLFNLISVVR